MMDMCWVKSGGVKQSIITPAKDIFGYISLTVFWIGMLVPILGVHGVHVRHIPIFLNGSIINRSKVHCHAKHGRWSPRDCRGAVPTRRCVSDGRGFHLQVQRMYPTKTSVFAADIEVPCFVLASLLPLAECEWGLFCKVVDQ